MSTKQSRSKTGCLTCKTRRKKCDEQRPTCERCARAKMECLGYSYLDNPEELAQARAKIAASRATRASEQPNSPLSTVAGPSQFAAWRGHPVPIRSGSAPSDMTASGVPSHDLVRDASHSEGDTAQLDVMEFPFLSQTSVPGALDSQPHGHSNNWWGAGSSVAVDESGVGQSFIGQGVASTSGHHSTSVEFHQPRHSEDSQLFLAGDISHPNYTISGVNPLRRSRSETARYPIEDTLFDHDSDSTDDSDHENITGISYAWWMSQTVFEPMRSAHLLRGHIIDRFMASEESRATLTSIANVVRTVGKSYGLTPNQVSHIRMLHRRVQNIILVFNASEPHIYEQGTQQAMKTLNSALEIMPVHLATSSLATSVSLLREVALAFKRAVLEPPGHPINLPSKLIVPNADLRQYSAMDVMTSLGTGCPMSFQYDVTYSDPVLGASGVFDAADALGLQWMDDTTRRVDLQEIGEIEQSIRGWQPRYPLSQDPHFAVTRLAVQECWRQTLLIYLYMGICKTTSEDHRVQTAHKNFMKLIKTVQPRRIPDLFLLLPFFVVSVASSHTADRNKIYGRMRGIRECRTSGTAGSDLVDMVVDIWKRADSENRPALWADVQVAFNRVTGL
ncbi:Sterol regulatory element-binding protein ECM22 [Rhizoctonia solani]|uniref:Sterol regulatory element-binding protein ECM22 n=1 Tax=Rhizoctonia solani TaxID=456999 RepID=A0A0K6GDV2_9AGAM|nr:Sterol regulatory element-binding protein ECM22 [Rhizoctonia solani]